MMSPRSPRRALPGAALVTLLALAGPLSAQDGGWDPQEILAAKEWVAPPAEIAEAALAPRHLNVTLSQPSPNGRWFAEEVGDGPVTMDRFSLPFDELGGVFIDAAANRHRNFTVRSNVGLKLISATDGSEVAVEIPRGARVTDATWSPDGSRIAFFAHFPDATHIFVADPASGRSRQVTREPVLATLVRSFQWTGGGDEIATVLLPRDRAPRPREPQVPTGPQVKQTLEGENMLRTYASLMAPPHDEALLEWHATGQLARIDVDSRRVTRIGEPAMIWGMDFAPDGAHAMVELLQRPFSYVVPVSSFGRVTEIWDAQGTRLAQVSEREMSLGVDGNLPSAPGVGGSDEEADKRDVAWRTDGQGLTYLQMEPEAEESEEGAEEEEEGNGRNGRKDRVMQWLPPFGDDDVSVVYESSNRLASHRFSPDHGILFAQSRRGSTTHEFAVFLEQPDSTFTIYRHDRDDFYENPGSLVMQGSPSWGGSDDNVLLSGDGGHVFLTGMRYHEDPMEAAPQAFLDRVEIRTGEKERIFESANEGVSERLAAILDADARAFVVSRESPTEVRQYYRHTPEGETRLTDNVDHTPDITNAPRERFVVERPDGFRFMVDVTLPNGYREGTRLAAMFWFYPREYTDQEDYDERARTFNKNSAPNFGTRSIEYLVRLGYAVVEPDAPIVGDEGQMNNNYEHDLRNNLSAVIDELDAREIIDRKRLGLGGHSYGAFSTLNAMVHTPFFKAGIAGDGNYNRTLTPLRFQSERRIFWDAKDVYLSMSPFMHANNLTGAVLLYHGLHDQNVGTAPEHSPRLFHALNGLGKEAAMYLYPFEDHGPATRETILDLWARWTAWLEVHLGEEDRDETITQDGAGMD